MLPERTTKGLGIRSAAVALACLMLVHRGGLPASIADARVPRKPAVTSPVSPTESLKQFQLQPKLRIELAAAEPQVIDPVAIAFDEDQRLWGVEMGDYPNGPPKGEPPTSQIRLLTDDDGDGYYENARVFAEELLFTTGVQPWKGGVIVTLAGEVAYLKDTDGDGKADVRETWFTGFSQQNPQLRANHPTFGLDNRVYIANGLRGGDVIAARKQWKDGATPVSISGMDFRFDPRNGNYEAVSGVGQFGLTFDHFGNRFVCSNRNPCKHVVLPNRYLKRNRSLGVSSVVQDVSTAGEKSRVYPIARSWTTSTLHTGQFTAACGVTIYRGDALPREMQGNSFTCEPTGSLVHRDVLKPDGASFSSRPGRKEIEFLASRDEWFRPVNLANGPDGALYVVDFYRAVIEHPQWVPDELKTRRDLHDGNDRGRIYRIVSKGDKPSRQRRAKLSSRSSADLVKLLAHTNSWQRETAARLLYERQDRSVRPVLETLAVAGKSPQSRIHALWALDGLGLLSAELVLRALDDSSPRVQEQAVLLAEHVEDESWKILQGLVRLTTSADPRLRYQIALSLGELGKSETIRELLVTTAILGADDQWTRTAVASSVGANPASFLQQTLKRLDTTNRWNKPGLPQLIAQVAELVGAQTSSDQAETALRSIAHIPATRKDAARAARIWITASALEGLGKGLGRRGQSLLPLIRSLPKQPRMRIEGTFGRAIKLAGGTDVSTADRRRALSVLKYANYTDIAGPLQKLVIEESNQAVQLAAIDTLSAFSAAEIGELLLRDFESKTPALRRAVLSAMLSNEKRTGQLLDAVESGQVPVREMEAAGKSRLTRHKNAAIRKRAGKLFAAAVPADRKKVLDEYAKVLSLKADPKRGQLVFQKTCAACHRIGKTGVNVAPDIADSRSKTPEFLLTSILDPNRAVDSNYFGYVIVTKQGKVLTGLISAETASSVTLKLQDAKSITVLRDEIDEMRSTGLSLMPAGVEKDVSHQQMADLISFIKNWRYLDGSVPIDVGP